MKKIVAYLIIFLLFVPNIKAQFNEKINVSLFSGAYFAPRNTNNMGYWYGLYAEYMPIRTYDGVRFGFSFLATNGEFRNNTKTTKYQSQGYQFGFGLSGGKYWEYFSLKNSAYLGMNLMLRTTQDLGSGQFLFDHYQMKQGDLLLSSEINLSVLKSYGFKPRLFNKRQYKVGFVFPVSSDKEDYWNNELIPESIAWNKASYQGSIKLNIYEFDTFNNYYPIKVHLGYQYYSGDESSWLVYGPELAVRKSGKDDFLILNLFVKQRVGTFESTLNDTQIGMNINVIIN